MTPKKNQLYRKIIFYSIGLTLILQIILPFALIYAPDVSTEIGEEWQPNYLFSDEFGLILLPFYLFFILYLVSKNKTVKGIAKLILFLFAILYFGYAFLVFQTPLIDFVPGFGLLLLFLFLPELIYLHYMDMWIKYYEENPN